MSKFYNVNLGNNKSQVRKNADEDYIKFWNNEAKNLYWFNNWSKTLDWDYPFARWFVGGTINASYNALDVHQKTKAQKLALIWEGEDGSSITFTYKSLFDKVQQFSNVLLSLNIKKNDRVAIYLPMIPEIIISILACARIGAVHTVIFSGFSKDSLYDRLRDSGSKILITADGGYRRGKIIPLKNIADKAVEKLNSIQNVIVVKRTNQEFEIQPRDRLWDNLIKEADTVCKATPLSSSHPLYILYTSGTTGKPKGVLHGTGGYLVHLNTTFRWLFDIKDSDVYFCTADIGWVTGHSYVAYAPLMAGSTQVIYEGALDYPDTDRIWDILQKYNVSIFYTTPTAIRMFTKHTSNLDSFNLSLRLLGTVGEPINPKVWEWYFRIVGKSKCPIVDTWWQTETGGVLISPLPGIESIPLKPGSATRPIPGLQIDILDDSGKSVKSGMKGHLVIKNPWPGMLQTLWNDDEKYTKTYWSRFKMYHTGDYAIKDGDGYIWLLGRADDLLKIAGHRIGTAEIEHSILSHKLVVESAVCGVPDEIKGESAIAFVVLSDVEENKTKQEIIQVIRDNLGAIAVPKNIYFTPRLPKTRSGKIMRRLLRSIYLKEPIGNTSTLEDPTVLDEIQILFD